MNEKLQYASMLGINENTCNIVYKPVKTKRKKTKKTSDEQIKKELVEKVNLISEKEASLEEKSLVEQPIAEETAVETEQAEQTSVIYQAPKKKKKFKFSVVGVQLTVIALLVAVIGFTSALYPNSGIKNFISSVFGSKNTTIKVDERTFDEFAPVFTADDQSVYTLNEGIISVSGRGSVYSPCDGTVSSLSVDENGKYNVEVQFSENFKAVFSGLDFSYAEMGGKVYSNIPMGFIKTAGEVCFIGEDDQLITSYTLENNVVKWAV